MTAPLDIPKSLSIEERLEQLRYEIPPCRVSQLFSAFDCLQIILATSRRINRILPQMIIQEGILKYIQYWTTYLARWEDFIAKFPEEISRSLTINEMLKKPKNNEEIDEVTLHVTAMRIRETTGCSPIVDRAEAEPDPFVDTLLRFLDLLFGRSANLFQQFYTLEELSDQHPELKPIIVRFQSIMIKLGTKISNIRKIAAKRACSGQITRVSELSQGMPIDYRFNIFGL